MKILIVLGHQQKGSFCHAIVETAMEEFKAAGHEVVYHDLYDENFDPILPAEEVPSGSPVGPIIEQHCSELMSADGILVVHPNWWGQPPAILKGWVDRVIRQGIAYEFGEGGAIVGHLRGKTVLVVTTSNTPREAEMQMFGDPLQNLWENCIFRFCGVETFYRRNFESIILSTPEQRNDWLGEVREMACQYFPAG